MIPDAGYGIGNYDACNIGVLKRLAADGRDAFRNNDVAAEAVVFFEDAVTVNHKIVRRGDGDGTQGHWGFSRHRGANCGIVAGMTDCRDLVIEVTAAFTDKLGFQSVVVHHRKLRGRGAGAEHGELKGVGSAFFQRERNRRVRADRRAGHRRKGGSFVSDARRYDGGALF